MIPGSVAEFRRIDPARNIARVYVLEAGPRQCDLFEEANAPRLLRAWGRLGRPLRRKVEVFASWAELAEAWEVHVRRRLRHGYSPSP
jgi:predicted DNA-binding WGR domain protein